MPIKMQNMIFLASIALVVGGVSAPGSEESSMNPSSELRGDKSSAASKTDVEKSIKLLDLQNPLLDKTQGLVFAKRHDDPAITSALISLLDDKMEGGKVTASILAEAPWIVALDILVKRFPGSSIAPDSDYTRKDAANWKQWWEKNGKAKFEPQKK